MEIVFLLGKRLHHEHFQKVCHVKASVETNPSQRGVQDEAWLDNFLAKVLLGDPVHLKLIKVDTWIDEHMNRLVIFGLLVIIVVKIELPRWNWGGHAAIRVRESDT